MDRKKIAVAVVTYNRLSFLKNCINSLKNQSYLWNKLIVINNSSTDGTSEWLSEQRDIYTINRPNEGSAGGFYTAVKYTCENNFDFVWLMDDDVEVSENAL